MKELKKVAKKDHPKRILIYVHYNKDNNLSEHVLYQLQKIKPYYRKVIVLSNSKLAKLPRNKLEKYADTIIERENIGFDFAAWRDGMLNIGWNDLLNYDELTIMNDTCFGPIRDMSEIYGRFSENKTIDFWGITNHREEAYGMPGTMTSENPLGDPIPEYIQTYFVTFKNNVIQSKVFQAFWNSIEDQTDIKQAIIHYETQLTRLLESAGYVSGVLVETKDIAMPDYAPFHNACLWTPGILLPLSPFIKRKAFVRNNYASQIILSNFEKIDYPLSYILDYIKSIDQQAVTKNNAKLIVLRGNSGSGKTTIADRLKKELFYNVMVIGWDTLRIDIFNRFDYLNRDEHIFNTLNLLCEYGRKNNLTVILEGIYPTKQYQTILANLSNSFPESHFYYFDISFKESLRRHNMRKKRSEFGVQELKKWHIPNDTITFQSEKLISDKMQEDEIVEMILNDIKTAA